MKPKSLAWFVYFIALWAQGLFALTIEDAWRPPAFSSPKLSPDGRLVAVAVGGGDSSLRAGGLPKWMKFAIIDSHGRARSGVPMVWPA